MPNRAEGHGGNNPLLRDRTKRVNKLLHIAPAPKKSSPKPKSSSSKPRQAQVNNVKSFFKGAIAKSATRDPHDISYHKNTKIPLKQSDATRNRSAVGPKKASGGTSKSFGTPSTSKQSSGHKTGSLTGAAARRHAGKSNGGGGGQGGTRGGSGGGIGEKGLRNQASRMVQQDINSALRGLDHEAYARNKTGQYDINKLTALYDRSVGDLNHVFGEVNENTNLQNAKIDSRFNQGKTDLAGIYDALRSRLSTDSNANRDAASAEQARLGIQQSGLGNFDADASNSQGVASTHAADAQANMTTSQTAAAQIGGMIASMGQSSLAGNIGKAANTRNQGVNDINEDLRADLSDIGSAKREERLGKGAKVNDLWMQLSDRAFARRESNRNFALARRSQGFSEGMANNNFNLSVSKFNSDNLWKAAAQRQEDRRQAALRRQQASALRSPGRPNTSGGRSLNSGV